MQLGGHGKEEKAEPRDTFTLVSLLVVHLCVPSPSLADA